MQQAERYSTVTKAEADLQAQLLGGDLTGGVTCCCPVYLFSRTCCRIFSSFSFSCLSRASSAASRSSCCSCRSLCCCLSSPWPGQSPRHTSPLEGDAPRGRAAEGLRPPPGARCQSHLRRRPPRPRGLTLRTASSSRRSCSTSAHSRAARRRPPRSSAAASCGRQETGGGAGPPSHSPAEPAGRPPSPLTIPPAGPARGRPRRHGNRRHRARLPGRPRENGGRGGFQKGSRSDSPPKCYLKHHFASRISRHTN